jgi:AMP deaminase
MTNENSWPVESFHDRHLSASEPRIFPGLVSRHHRRESSVRSETEDYGGLVMGRKKGKNPATNNLNSAVEESSDEEA